MIRIQSSGVKHVNKSCEENPINDLGIAEHKNTYMDLPINILFHRVRNIPRTPADIFTAGTPYRPFILTHLLNEYSWLINWYLADFRSNPDHPEYLLLPVKLGYKVRSKSEVLSANRMYEEGLLFHYEEELIVKGETVYPDFIIPFTPLKKTIWEHSGAMDKERYLKHAKEKINDYLDEGWLPGINMITTYETKESPLIEEQVDHQIRWLKNKYRLAFPDLPPDESFNMYNLAAYAKYQKT